MLLMLCLAALLLAYSNGANDNFKGFATIWGSGEADYDTALRLATIATVVGAIAALYIANGLVANFSGRGLVPNELAGTPRFIFAVALGAGVTVLLATRLGFPISTTHAIIGGLVGGGHRILRAIDKHIPVEDVMSIDEVACRLDKVQQQPVVARKLARDIKHEIQTQVGECLTSSIGISANKLLAKLASNMQKPDGLVILPIEELPRAILHLKLRDIPGIGPNMAERLQMADIADIATLWKTDASRLRLIWGGVAGDKMHALLHGEDIVSTKHARSSISHQHVLAPNDEPNKNRLPSCDSCWCVQLSV